MPSLAAAEALIARDGEELDGSAIGRLAADDAGLRDQAA
jgi:hypothetical protein